MRTITVVLLLSCLLPSPSRGEGSPIRGPASNGVKVRVVIDPQELIRRVGRTYRVPAGVLDGIWAKESARMTGGWKTAAESPDWFPAKDIWQPGGACVEKLTELCVGRGVSRRTCHERYIGKCKKHWEALVALCRQRYRRGPKASQRICNPQEVYTSYALAMGPTQHMPGELVHRLKVATSRSRWQFTPACVDWNRDGACNPNDLDDAMASTAYQLRQYYEQKRSWRWAANRYYGSQHGGYFYGRWEWSDRRGTIRYRRGIRDYWLSYCTRADCR